MLLSRISYVKLGSDREQKQWHLAIPAVSLQAITERLALNYTACANDMEQC